jgi:small neutral amino acid transporter SnatA (MarC family)
MCQRFGVFFLFSGILAIIFFAISIQAENPLYWMCAGGLALFLIGFAMILHFRTPPPESTRFKTYNRLRNRRPGEKSKPR